MTNRSFDSSFLGVSGPISGTVGSFLSLRELCAAINEERGKGAPDRLFEQLLEASGGELVGITVSIPAEKVDEAVQFFKSDLCWNGEDCVHLEECNAGANEIVLVIDRLKVTSENKGRVTAAANAAAGYHSGKMEIIECRNSRWVKNSALEVRGAEGKEEMLSLTNDQRLLSFFEIASTKTSSSLVKDIHRYLQKLNISEPLIGTTLSDLPWPTLRDIIALRKSLLSPNPNLADINQPPPINPITTTFDIPQATEVPNPSLSVIIPTQVTGAGAIYKVLPIEEELLKFFKTLPASKQSVTQRGLPKESRTAILDSISYRGWTISELLKLNLEDFCLQFKNHPRFRMISNAVSHFGIGHIFLSEKFEHLSYEEAYILLVIRELRKLREEGRVYLPRELELHFSSEAATAFKDKLVNFLRFYRAREQSI